MQIRNCQANAQGASEQEGSTNVHDEITVQVKNEYYSCKASDEVFFCFFSNQKY